MQQQRKVHVKTRVVSVFAAMFAIAAMLSPAAIAQDATPSSGLEGFGFPTLDITVTADAFEGVPESIPAGRYLVTVTASEENAEGAGVGFVQPVGISADEFVASFSPGGGATGSPVDEDMAVPSPSDNEMGGEEEVPPFIFDSVFAGGVYAGPGATAQIILDLTPGEWVAWGDDPAAAWTPVAFEVTGEMPTDLTEPTSGATLTMGEYIINVTEGELVAGQQVIKIENIGAQPHFIVADGTQAEITNEDVAALLESEMTGTPAPVDFNPEEDFIPQFFTGTQSTGTTVWVSVDLMPGNLVLLCFFPDMGDGMPHAYHGMHNVVAIPE
jgi:hypothetical protein